MRLLCFVVMLMLGSNLLAQDYPESEIKILEEEVLRINERLTSLNQQIKFANMSSVTAYVRVEGENLFHLDSVTLQINGSEVASYIYVGAEKKALLNSGAHKLYSGDISSGHYEVMVEFIGRGSNDAQYKRIVSVPVEKKNNPLYLELKVVDRLIGSEPEFLINQW